MSIVKNFLDSLKPAERKAFSKIVQTILKHEPSADEGFSYGMPAFKLHDRPLIGFSKNKHGLNLYMFDPRVVSLVRPQLSGFEVGKGVIRFTLDKPIPEEIIELMIDLRKEFLGLD